MKRFLIQITVFLGLASIGFVLLLSRADGYTDSYYLRFASPQQESLILGTSKAAQGIHPQILDSICGTRFFNYAFTVDHSPYGETYLNSIKKKIKKGNKPGIFILTVDPWSISTRKENIGKPSQFRELERCLANTSAVAVNPNYEYLLKNLSGSYHTAVFKKTSPIFLHDNGWLEVTINMDSAKVEKSIQSKYETYKKDMLPNYQYSQIRFEALKSTIEFLNTYGDVYLVRLPIHPKMMMIEDELMPDFDDTLKTLIPLTKGYKDMTDLNDQLIYTDGNHLYKSSGKAVSRRIAEWIKS